MAAFLLGAGIVFVAALKHAVEMVWKRPDEGREPVASATVAWPLVFLPLVLLVVLGLWMPPAVRGMLDNAAAVIRGQP